jgi:hypothetical protein
MANIGLQPAAANGIIAAAAEAARYAASSVNRLDSTTTGLDDT